MVDLLVVLGWLLGVAIALAAVIFVAGLVWLHALDPRNPRERR